MSKEEEEYDFEIAVAVSKREQLENDNNNNNNGAADHECVDVLVEEFNKAGMITERIIGLSDDFIKLAARLDTLCRVATKLKVKKPTHIGVDLLFKFEDKDAFIRQADGSLFSWSERFRFYHHLIYGITNKNESGLSLKHQGRIISWEGGESLLRRLESEGIVKEVFPLHVEIKRKRLLDTWALNWRDITTQPVDEIYSYFGSKMAIYFAFLGMYTRWSLFPAFLGLVIQFVDFRSFQDFVLPVFFVSVVLWGMMFSQFWKRKNAALLTRWQMYSFGAHSSGYGDEPSSSPPVELFSKLRNDRQKYKEVYQRHEWFGTLMRFRNDAFVILSIICFQLPLELAYAHLYGEMDSDIAKFALTAFYLINIQYFTRICGRISVRLISYENNANREYRADSLIYKVFGLYFMQSYIGLFYHALIHGNFTTLRKVLIQRLIVSEVLGNFRENMIPYMKYKYGKYKVRSNTKHEKGSSTHNIKTRVEKEYLKPAYSASIGEELEDGLFDDMLELSLQFGTMMMLACAYPPAFVFSALNNVMEIRTDALKLLVTMKRPVPRAAASIGAWLNIFQFLIVMSICTNSVLLVWLYDREGKWKIEPGLAAILAMEHVLLLIKFGISQFVPDEPAWVRANRVENAAQVQELYSNRLLPSVSATEKELTGEELKQE